jgi:hypothetical protein
MALDYEMKRGGSQVLLLLENPEGILSFSPGLRGTRYPGSAAKPKHQSQRGCITGSPDGFNLSGLCLCRLSTQRRPTLPANAGLDDGIPLGCSETARRRGDRSSSKKLDCCESVAGSEDFPVPVKNFAPWARVLGL